MRATVLGAGSFGTTIASLLAPKNDTVLWARREEVASEVNAQRTNSRYLAGFTLPESLRASADLEEAVGDAEVLIVGIPTAGFRRALEEARPFIHPWIPVVSLTKGLEPDSLLRMSDVAKDVLPGHPVAALTGPNIAFEIMEGKAATSVIATEDRSVGAALQQVLRRGAFRVYWNHDLAGCELGGALKNVIAIAAGMAEGVGVGDNSRAAIIARGLAELTRLGVAMGGEPTTFAGLTGLGDLVVTCMSPRSRNRHVGEQLGRGRKLEEILAEMTMVAEGVSTAATVVELAKRHDVPMPICEQVHRVLQGEITGSEAYSGIHPDAGHEADPG